MSSHSFMAARCLAVFLYDLKCNSNFQFLKVFMVRKVVGPDAGTIYAMKVLKKATLKGFLPLQYNFSIILLQYHLLSNYTCKKYAAHDFGLLCYKLC